MKIDNYTVVSSTKWKSFEKKQILHLEHRINEGYSNHVDGIS